MNAQNDEQLQLIDLGDAMGETRQLAPRPDGWPDSMYGLGIRPD